MLSDLEPLVGRWTVELTWSEKTHRLVGGPPSVKGPARFEWTRDGYFIVLSTGGEAGPLAEWIIGRDDTSGAFAALYADSRGVSRIYEMSSAENVWKVWRAVPGFHQRFIGRISPDRRSIEACWQKSVDGTIWENDFDLTYTKAE